MAKGQFELSGLDNNSQNQQFLDSYQLLQASQPVDMDKILNQLGARIDTLIASRPNIAKIAESLDVKINLSPSIDIKLWL